MDKGRELSKIWSEVEADLKEKTPSGYKMALIDADKILRSILKEKGYPGKNLIQQLFWSGVKVEKYDELKRAIGKKDEILNSTAYQLSTLELDDFLAVYKSAISQLYDTKRLKFYHRLYLLFEKNFSHNLKKSLKIFIITFIVYLFGIKFLTSTETGKNFVSGTIHLNDFIFNWLVNITLIVLILAVIVGIVFLILEKRKSVKIRDEE